MSPSSDNFLTIGSDDGRPARILLVEDNPADVRLTREMLHESKVRNELLVANTAKEAEEILGLSEIKSHSQLRRIPVVMLTGSEAEEDIVKSYDEYANAYVTKPIDLNEISRVVNTIEDFWFQVVRLPAEQSPN